MVRVSIIIPTLNEGKYLAKCLSALKKQTYKDFEIIISDSSSNDDTIRIAKRFKTIVSEGPRKGPGAGRNLGAKIAKGKILLFLDADYIPSKNLVKYVARSFNDKEVVEGTVLYYPINGDWFDKILFKLINISVAFLSAIERPHAAGCCLFVRCDVFNRVHGFREDLIFNEDQDLILRAKRFGKFVRLNNAFVRISLRRVKKSGYFYTIFKQYLRATLHYSITKTTPKHKFKHEVIR